jgi:hypothetical protein
MPLTYYIAVHKLWQGTSHLIKFQLKVKVNFTVEQAMKTQRGRRGIALLFL